MKIARRYANIRWLVLYRTLITTWEIPVTYKEKMMTTLQCRYCATVFNASARGGCPQCGGPNPTVLEPEKVAVVQREYVYVSKPQSDYYAPRFSSHPYESVRSIYFGSLGFKLGSFLLFILAIGLVLSFVWALTYRAPALVPQDRNFLPTSVPTATTAVDTNPWQNEQWLSSDQAKALRYEENVVNLAYLKNGGAFYSVDHSVTAVFTDAWQNTKPLGMTELNINGTSVRFNVGGYVYTLNVFQPFVLDGQPEKINVIDPQGHVWQADILAVKIQSLADVKSMLTTTLAPNPNLSFTY